MRAVEAVVVLQLEPSHETVHGDPVVGVETAVVVEWNTRVPENEVPTTR
jgi:hypothetical protein